MSKLKLSLLLFFMPVWAFAQQQVFTLQQCIDYALEHNIDLQSERLAVAKAHDMQGTAVDLEKTEVVFGQDLTTGGNPDNGFTISQSFEFPTVYVARGKYLKAETAAQKGELAVVRNQLRHDVASAYCTLVYNSQLLRIRKNQDSVYHAFMRVAKIKRQADEAKTLEELNAERLHDENVVEIQRAEQVCNANRQQLMELLGTDKDVVLADTVLAVMPHQEPEGTASFEQTPMADMLVQRKNASERNLKLAKQGYMPDLSVALKTQLVWTGLNPYNVDRSRFKQGNLLGFEVGVSVPLFWGGQKARVKAARHDMEQVELDRQKAERSMNMSYRNALNEYYRAQEALKYCQGQSVNGEEKLRKLSQISYESGKIDYVEYMQNLSTVLEMQLQRVDAINELNQAIINISYLKGNL